MYVFKHQVVRLQNTRLAVGRKVIVDWRLEVGGWRWEVLEVHDDILADRDKRYGILGRHESSRLRK